MKYLISFILSCLLLVGCIDKPDIDGIKANPIEPVSNHSVKSLTITHENHSYVVFYAYTQTLFVIHNPDCNCHENFQTI